MISLQRNPLKLNLNLFLIFIFLFITFFSYSEEKLEITSKKANIRKCPSSKCKIIARLKKGIQVDFVMKKGEWYKIKLSENKFGWVNNSIVKKIELSETYSDTVVLKDNRTYTGKIIAETPRIVLLDHQKKKIQFKRHLVRKIIYNRPNEERKIKYIDEREYTAYTNYPVELKKDKLDEDIKLNAVGIMTFTGSELIESNELKVMTDRFRTELFQLNKFNIMEQEKMDALMEEQGFQQTACTEISCYIEAGKVIGVNQMLFGSVARIKDVITIAIKIVDVETGQIIKSTVYDTKDDMKKILSKHLPILAEKIAGKASARKGVYAFDVDKKREPIAVLKLDANGITVEEGQGLTDRLRAELFNTGKFQVIERNEMITILNEQGFQKTIACADQACLVEAGQLMGVKYIIGGSITKLSNTFTVSARIIDVATGKIVRVATEDTKNDLESVLKQTMHDIARGLAGLKIYSRKNTPRMLCLISAGVFTSIGGVLTYFAGETYKLYNEEEYDIDLIGQYRDKYFLQYYSSVGCYSAAGLSVAGAVYFHFKKRAKIKVLDNITFKPHFNNTGATLVCNF